MFRHANRSWNLDSPSDDSDTADEQGDAYLCGTGVVPPGVTGGSGQSLAPSRGTYASRMYLQVETENEAAIGLYESEGFRTHHTYAYLVARAPAGD